MKNRVYLIICIVVISMVSCMSKEAKERQQIAKARMEEQRLYQDSIECKVSKDKIVEEQQRNSLYKAEYEKEIEELKPYFAFKKDEFSSSDKQWVTPKDAPKYVNRNGIYCYFQVIDGKASNFRLKIQYVADDWLFIQNYIFSIDDMIFEYSPDNIESDNDSSIWEWSDNQITRMDYNLINALAIANKAKIKFEGRQYYKVKDITSSQLKSIQRTIRLFKALGGVL